MHLIELSSPKSASDTAALDHFAFSIRDYDGMKRKLDADSVAYRELNVPNAPVRQLFIRDPNGVAIELNCREVEVEVEVGLA